MLPEINHKNQSGQALIIILMAMAVVLTLVLSSVSRSVTDIRITTEEEESLRAFSAAEAGVEQALLELSTTGSFTPSGGFFPDASYEVVEDPSPVGSVYQYPRSLEPGESATIWFVGQDMNGDLFCEDDHGNNICIRPSVIKLCYGDNNGYDPPPEVEIQIYYDPTYGPGAEDPPSSIDNLGPSGEIDGDFSSIQLNTRNPSPQDGCNVTGFEDNYAYRIPVINPAGSPCNNNNRICILAIKVKSLYANRGLPIAIEVAGAQPSLPAQGAMISSTGTSGESQRRLNVEYNLSNIPGIFDTTLFSNSALTK